MVQKKIKTERFVISLTMIFSMNEIKNISAILIIQTNTSYLNYKYSIIYCFLSLQIGHICS